jgi:hypothetical protein
VRFLHEPASWKEVLGAMFRISPLVTMRVAGSLAISLLSNRAYVDRFVSRYRTVKGGS